jgi:hypothetical protein
LTALGDGSRFDNHLPKGEADEVDRARAGPDMTSSENLMPKLLLKERTPLSEHQGVL